MDPPHPHRPWKDLPAGLLADIARRLPCLADRVHMSKLCRSWRAAAHPPPCQLPLLLLPYRGTTPLPPGTARTAAFFCVLGGDTHSLRIRYDTGGARFFGSYHGGWLFLAHGQTRLHALVNLHTYRRIPLPDSVLWVGGRTHNPDAMVILAATLSSPPPAPQPTEQCIAATVSSPPMPTEPCIAAAIVATGRSPSLTRPPECAFWRVEAGGQVQVASGFMWMWQNIPVPPFVLKDVIHHKGAFYFLTDEEDVIVCTAEYREEEGLVVHPEHRFVLPGEAPRNHDLHVTARYLVESRGELLMIVKGTPYPGWPTTWAFMVFQMTQQQLPDGVVQRTWTELPTLDGRMLFVARGCSRSYEVADFPGFQDGVYFLDDRSSYDVAMMFQNHLYREYTCNDNGSWSGPPPRRWFPDQDPSNYSSPVWFLP